MKIYIALTGQTYVSSMVFSLLELIIEAQKSDINLFVFNGYDADVSIARLLSLSKLTSDFDYVLTIDRDISGFTFNNLMAMIDILENIKNAGAVFGIYRNVNGHMSISTQNIGDGKELKWMDNSDLEKQSDVFNIEYSGLGFSLIRSKIFSKLSFPAFQNSVFNATDERDKKDNIIFLLSEDVTFCRKIRYLNYDLYAVKNIQLTHSQIFSYK